MPAHGLSLRKYIELAPPSTSQYDVAFACGASLVASSDVIVNVASGVILSNRMTSGFSWPDDCTLRINILDGGKVQGRGGNGANYTTGADGHFGLAGGDAIQIQAGNISRVYLYIIGTGVLAAGAGGGGSGGAESGVPSGAGGGGAGIPGGSAGTSFAGTLAAGNGTATGGGAGGGGSFPSSPGGKGGGVAGDGAYGKDSSSHIGGRGGDAGAAYRATGMLPPIILAGNDSAHIKGLIVT
jgi:hypothetical protein